MNTENQIVTQSENGGYTLSTKGGEITLQEGDIRHSFKSGARGFIPLQKFRELTGTKGAEAARLHRTLINQIGSDDRCRLAAVADRMDMIATKHKWGETRDGRKQMSITMEEIKPITPPKQGGGQSKLKAENQTLKAQVEAMAKMLGVDPDQLPQQ